MGLGIGIGDSDWGLELRIKIGDWDWGLGIGIGDEDWDWGLGGTEIGIGSVRPSIGRYFSHTSVFLYFENFQK